MIIFSNHLIYDCNLINDISYMCINIYSNYPIKGIANLYKMEDDSSILCKVYKGTKIKHQTSNNSIGTIINCQLIVGVQDFP